MLKLNNLKEGLDSLKNVFNSEDDNGKSYLNILYESIDNKRLENKSVKFKIDNIKEYGFIIKVGGLFGYISFNHMPWKYVDFGSWKIIFKYLKDKIFLAKVFEISKNNERIMIKLNGEIQQFTSPNLVVNDEYNGIIIKKSNTGIYVDFGYHYKWFYGSIQTYIHKYQFKDQETFDSYIEGQIIEGFYWGINENNQYIFGIDDKLKDWVTGEINLMMNAIVSVKVSKTSEGKNNYLVDGKYSGFMLVTKSIYPGINRNLIKIAISNLNKKEIINCKVIAINHRRKQLMLKWISNQEIEKVLERIKTPEVKIEKYVDLIIDEKYNGIIKKKANYGVFVDFGYHFNYAYGPIHGMIHKSQFKNNEEFSKLKLNQIIASNYWGKNKDDQDVFGLDTIHKDWVTNKIDELIGEIVKVKVIIQNSLNQDYIINDKYKGLMPIKRDLYPNIVINQLKRAVTSLNNEEIISCEIIGINYNKRLLILKWIDTNEMTMAIARNIPISERIKIIKLEINYQNKVKNRIDTDLATKLNMIGDIVNVEVIKNDDKKSTYLIEGNYKGILSIENINYRISESEKQRIEQNLQDGDIIKCNVLSINRNLIKVRWEITDDELSRFIRL